MKIFLLSALFLSLSFLASAQCDLVTLDATYQGCEDDVINLESGADDTAIIQWFVNNQLIPGETSPVLSVTSSGNYSVEAMQQGAVCTATTDVVFAISPTISFSTFVNDNVFCQGESIEITASVGFCNTAFNEITFIPDGNNTIISVFIDVTCFSADAILENVNDLEAICLNMEHSFLGDLAIELIAPNGSSATLHSSGGGNVFLGEPVDDNSSLPGLGYEYCFTQDADVLLLNGPTEIIYTIFAFGDTILGGSYLPEEDFSQLLGTPLNGLWEIRISDNLAMDDGYLFSAALQFNEDLLPSNDDIGIPNEILTQSWLPDPTIISTDGNTIVVQPNSVGEFCYDYMVTDDFGCTVIDTICISMEPGAITCEPDPLVVCDDDNDGIATFDLTAADNQIYCDNPSGGLFIDYYETFENAENNFADVSSPYTNIIPNQQIIYARLTNLNTGCFDIVELELIVLETPAANQAPDLVLVDNNGDGIEVFDLTTNGPIITGGDPDASVLYFETLADADNGVNTIIDPIAYISTSATIYVRVENGQTGCVNLTSFNIIVDPLAPVDTDDDGIPDTEEDLNGNGDLEDDDTDNDGIPNYLDTDDDGDTVPTATEIEGIGAGFAPQDFIDTDDDGIENYLDDDDDGDGALTIEEDYNNNGTPLDDDTNNNDIPDFLDFDVNLGVTDFTFGNVTLVPNPAINEVMVSWSQSTTVAVVNLYSISGELVQRTGDVVDVSETSISLADLSIGVYFVQLVAQDGQISTQKLIKK